MTVQNVGSGPLRIDSIYVAGSDRFSWSISDPDQPARENDSDEWPSSLAPQQHFDVRVTFNPDDPLPESAELILVSNDPASPNRVGLSANSPRPCLRVNPSEELHFWQSSTHETTGKNVLIENCSRDVDLEFDEVKLTDDGSGAYALTGENLPDIVAPGESIFFEVEFAPPEEREYTRELSILTSTPNEEVRIALAGEGSNSACPTAVAAASVQGRNSSGTSLQTVPASTIEFDGTASSSPDRNVTRYEWTLLNRPQGSTARLTPDHHTDRPELFVDMAGIYEFGLKVYDDMGMVSCGEPARITIAVVPESDVYVELVWDTPSDRHPNHTTSIDLDLHYLHSDGNWTQAPWDIYSENISADWGAQGDTSDDPKLILEDNDGTGPEAVSHSGLKSGVDYRVGAYYSDANSLGTSYASVRIYVDGTLEFESAYDYLVRTGDFRTFASIQDGGASIIDIDQLYDGFP